MAIVGAIVVAAAAWFGQLWFVDKGGQTVLPLLTQATESAASTATTSAPEALNPAARTISAQPKVVTTQSTSAPDLVLKAAYFPPPDTGWAIQFGTADKDGATSVAVDANENAFVIGETTGVLGGSVVGEQDIWLAKIDRQGHRLWMRQFGSEEDDFTTKVMVDTNGNVYAVGYTSGSLFGDHAGGDDGWIVSFDGDGNERWSHQYGDGDYESFTDLTIANRDTLYVVGVTNGVADIAEDTTADALLLAFDTAGAQLWEKSFGSTSADFAVTAVGGAQGLYIAGITKGLMEGAPPVPAPEAILDVSPVLVNAWLAKVNWDGTPSWVRQFGDQRFPYMPVNPVPVGIAMDDQENAYLVGLTYDSTTRDASQQFKGWLYYTDADGANSTMSGLGPAGGLIPLTIDATGAGAVFASGVEATGEGSQVKMWLGQVGAYGNLDWVETIGSTQEQPAFRMDVSPSGSVLLAGATSGDFAAPNLGQQDVWLARIPISEVGTPSFPPELARTLPRDFINGPAGIYSDLSGTIVFVSSRDHPSEEAQGVLLGAHELYAMAPSGVMQSRLTDLSIRNFNPAVISPDGQRILTAGENGVNVRLLDVQGTVLQQYSYPGNAAYPLSWSQDGKAVLFLIAGDGSAEFSEQIYRMEYPAGGFTPLTTEPVRHLFASWSPDGQQIAFMRDYKIWLMDADGGNQHLLLDQAARDLAWSPKGDTIVFEGQPGSFEEYNWDIWQVNVDGSNARNLTNTDDLIEFSPHWSPSGNQIVYSASPTANGITQVYTLDLATGKRLQLTTESNNQAVQWLSGTLNLPTTFKDEPQYPFTHEMLAFTMRGEIWTMRDDGSELTQLTDLANTLAKTQDASGEPASLSRIEWSPDGQRIAFIYGDKLYLIGANGGEPLLLAEGLDPRVLDWKDKNLAFLLRNRDDPATLDMEIRVAYINMDDPAFAVQETSYDWALGAMGIGSDVVLELSGDGIWAALSYANVRGMVSLETSQAVPLSGEQFNRLLVHPVWKPGTLTTLWAGESWLRPSGEGSAYEVDALTGALSPSYAIPAQYFVYSPDHANLAYADPTLKVMASAGGPALTLVTDWTMQPKWSPLGDKLLYLRWIANADDANPYPQSVGWYLVNVADGNHHLFLPMADQVEWRPVPAGELVTVEPALEYDGHLYRIQYRTWQLEELPPDHFLQIIATIPLDKLQSYPLSGLLVTRDGEPVRDAEELRTVFELYSTAYYLYQANANDLYNSDDLAGMDEALGDVLDNPVLKATNLQILFEHRGDRVAEAVRAIIVNNGAQTDFTELMQATADEIDRGAAVADAINQVAYYSTDPQIHQAAKLIATDLPDWRVLDNTLKTSDLEAGIPLPISTADVVSFLIGYYNQDVLKQEDMDLLQAYDDRFGNTDYAWDDLQAQALTQVEAEVQSAAAQRGAYVSDFFNDKVEHLLGDGLSALSYEFAVYATQRAGVANITSHVAGSLYASIGMGVSLGEFLIGTDALYEHFQLAEEANLMRQKSEAARKWLVGSAASHPNNEPYSGKQIESYRIALQAEMLAANQVRTSYNDGVAATIAKNVFSPVYLYDYITSLFAGRDDWGTIVTDLRADAARRQRDFQASFVNSANIPYLVSLAQQNTPFMLPVYGPPAPTAIQATEVTTASISAGVPSTSTQPNVAQVTGIVSADVLNVRSGPSGDAEIGAEVVGGTQVIILERSADGAWLHITLPDGGEGWVSAQFVVIEEGDATSNATQDTTQNATQAPCSVAVDPALTSIWNQATTGCPRNSAFIMWAAVQPYEHGFLFWREDQIGGYAFTNDGTWVLYPDGWDGSEPSYKRGMPPDGFVYPIRGFGYLWEKYDEIFAKLGWPLERERGVCLLIQEMENGFVLTTSDGSGCSQSTESADFDSSFRLEDLSVSNSGQWTR